jgi:hypothetical protein
MQENHNGDWQQHRRRAYAHRLLQQAYQCLYLHTDKLSESNCGDNIADSLTSFAENDAIATTGLMTMARSLSIGACAAVLALWILGLSKGAISHNAGYHAELARVLWGGDIWTTSLRGLSESFPEGIFINQHWLYHLILGPIQGVFAPPASTKVLNALSVGFLAAVLSLLMVRVRLVIAFTAALAGVFWFPASLIHLLQERPEPLIIGAFLLAIPLIDRGSSWGLALLAFFLGKLSYFGFLLPLLILMSIMVVRRRDERSFLLKSSCLTALAFLASLILHPHPFLSLNYFVKLSFLNSQNIDGISEWQSPLFEAPLTALFVVGLGFLLCFTAYGVVWRRTSPSPWGRRERLVVLWMMVFLILSLKAWRFVPFATTLMAVTAGLLLADALAVGWRRANVFAVLIPGAMFALVPFMIDTRLKNPFPAASFALLPSVDQKLSEGGSRQFLNYSWEYWGHQALLGMGDKFFPGFAPFVLRAQSNEVMNLWRRFRQDPQSLTVDDIKTFRAAGFTHAFVSSKDWVSDFAARVPPGFRLVDYNREFVILAPLVEFTHRATTAQLPSSDELRRQAESSLRFLSTFLRPGEPTLANGYDALLDQFELASPLTGYPRSFFGLAAICRGASAKHLSQDVRDLARTKCDDGLLRWTLAKSGRPWSQLDDGSLLWLGQAAFEGGRRSLGCEIGKALQSKLQQSLARPARLFENEFMIPQAIVYFARAMSVCPDLDFPNYATELVKVWNPLLTQNPSSWRWRQQASLLSPATQGLAGALADLDLRRWLAVAVPGGSEVARTACGFHSVFSLPEAFPPLINLYILEALNALPQIDPPRRQDIRAQLWLCAQEFVSPLANGSHLGFSDWPRGRQFRVDQQAHFLLMNLDWLADN